jgi:hypothetical protein
MGEDVDNCHEHEHVRVNAFRNIFQYVPSQQNDAEAVEHSDDSDDELGELQQQELHISEVDSDSDSSDSESSDSDSSESDAPMEVQNEPEFNFGTHSIGKLMFVDDVNASSVADSWEMRHNGL